VKRNRFHAFIAKASAIVDRGLAEHETLMLVGREARVLVQRDDWLPPCFTSCGSVASRPHLLYLDPMERFSVVSFTWAPGQQTPIHDHRTWAVIGMLRGAEIGDRFLYEAGALKRTSSATLRAGGIELVSPSVGDIHRVANASATRMSVSIHVYGGNIGKISRHVFEPRSGARMAFVSGYANADTLAFGYAPQLATAEARPEGRGRHVTRDTPPAWP